MAHESREKKGFPMMLWVGIGLILVGVLIGVYASEGLSPWINPQRASMIESVNALQTQNKLLKEQVDCLVNGITANHGKATIDECT